MKIGKLTHQDLGQMQMYVNYYDRYERTAEENPTIGVLLCQQKSDALVELTLPADSNIYASKYELYLPDKKEFQKKLKEYIPHDTFQSPVRVFISVDIPPSQGIIQIVRKVTEKRLFFRKVL